jgi:uncharacterized metal-binding protein YceD (DUF177 family)
MDRLNRFTIPFAGLAKGNHQFDYEIDDAFFELFEHSVIEHARMHVVLDFNKADTSLILTFRIKGVIHLTCDRCLGPVEVPLDEQHVLLVRFGEPGIGETDDTIVISHDDHQLNVAQHIYDYLTLAVPMRVVHPDDENGQPGCDPEFLKRLLDSSPEPQTDPRWDVLRNIGRN